MAAGHFDGTVVGELLAECDIGAGEAPHVLLAVLWASMVTAPEDLLVFSHHYVLSYARPLELTHKWISVSGKAALNLWPSRHSAQADEHPVRAVVHL